MSIHQFKYGFHRVIAPPGVFPQAAECLDNDFSAIHPSELLIAVEALHLDSSSFRQIKESCQNNLPKIKERILEIIETRGKMHNPVTNSGGMLIGRVIKKGAQFPKQVSEGDVIATLVSLSLTPLKVEEILSIEPESGVVKVRGQAVLFSTGIFQRIPDNVSLDLFLKAMDVCGAPAHTFDLCWGKKKVLILGAAGKSGVLSLAAAKKNNCPELVACDYNETALEKLKLLDLAHEYILVDATKPTDYIQKLSGIEADVVISCVNTDGAEMAAVVAAKDKGTICFFCMRTNFQKATLGAEGIGKDVDLIMGNGYKKNHAEFTLDLLGENDSLCNYLSQC